MRAFSVSIAIATCLLAAAGAAQAPVRPDLSGQWTAIMLDGNLIPPYLGEHLRIEHKEPLFTVRSKTQEGEPILFRFQTDGQIHPSITRKTQVRTTAKWDGDALMLTCELTSPKGEKATTKERWTLSPNRRKLAMQGYFVFGEIKKNQLLEYERK